MKWVAASPDGSGEWWTHRFPSNDAIERGLSLDPHGRDVGLEDPSMSSDGSGLGSYPAYGDPSDLVSGCAIDNSVVRCEVVGKLLSRNRVEVIAMLTGGRLGLRTPERVLSEVHRGDESLLVGTRDTPDGFEMTVAAPPPSLAARAASSTCAARCWPGSSAGRIASSRWSGSTATRAVPASAPRARAAASWAAASPGRPDSTRPATTRGWSRRD